MAAISATFWTFQCLFHCPMIMIRATRSLARRWNINLRWYVQKGISRRMPGTWLRLTPGSMVLSIVLCWIIWGRSARRCYLGWPSCQRASLGCRRTEWRRKVIGGSAQRASLGSKTSNEEWNQIATEAILRKTLREKDAISSIQQNIWSKSPKSKPWKHYALYTWGSQCKKWLH